MQIMPFEEAADYRFNPFDLTKVWPHGDYPPNHVGRFVLDRNPENHFAEVEQAGFSVSNLVPGTGLSPDKVLMAGSQLPRRPSCTGWNELGAVADQRAQMLRSAPI